MPSVNNGNCRPKFVKMARSFAKYPATVQPIAPVPCSAMFRGYIFKLVSKMPLKTQNVLPHLRRSIVVIMCSSCRTLLREQFLGPYAIKHVSAQAVVIGQGEMVEIILQIMAHAGFFPSFEWLAPSHLP